MFKIDNASDLIKFVIVMMIVLGEHLVFTYHLSISTLSIDNSGDMMFWLLVLFMLFIGLNIVTIFIKYAMASSEITVELLGLTLLSCIGANFNMAALKMIIIYFNL